MSEFNKPYEAHIDGRYCRLFPDSDSIEAYIKRYPTSTAPLGALAVSMFWKTPEQDYIQTYFPAENTKIITYDQRELLIWIGGVALNKEDQRILHLSNRENGSFEEKVGWRPVVIVKSTPGKTEIETYVNYEKSELDEEWSHMFDEEG